MIMDDAILDHWIHCISKKKMVNEMFDGLVFLPQMVYPWEIRIFFIECQGLIELVVGDVVGHLANFMPTGVLFSSSWVRLTRDTIHQSRQASSRFPCKVFLGKRIPEGLVHAYIFIFGNT